MEKQAACSALADSTRQHHQKCHWHISLQTHNHPHGVGIDISQCVRLCPLTLSGVCLFTPHGYPAHSRDELWELWGHSRWKYHSGLEREFEWQSITDDSAVRGPTSWREETPLFRPQAQKWERKMEREAEQVRSTADRCKTDKMYSEVTEEQR